MDEDRISDGIDFQRVERMSVEGGGPAVAETAPHGLVEHVAPPEAKQSKPFPAPKMPEEIARQFRNDTSLLEKTRESLRSFFGARKSEPKNALDSFEQIASDLDQAGRLDALNTSKTPKSEK